MNYYRRYVGDYLRDTARLSMLEHGAYTLLMDYSYADESPLPADKDEIYLIVRAMTPADRKAVDKVLAHYFTLETDGYHQARIDEEIERARAASETARDNGRLGGRPRKETGGQTGGQSGNDTNGETQQETKKESKKGSKAQSNTETKTETNGETNAESYHAGDPTTNHQPPPANRQPPTTNHQPTPPVEPPPQEGRGEARASRLPAHWRPGFDLASATYAEHPDWDTDRLERVLQDFRDHWTSKGEKREDWDAAWRKWTRAERPGKAHRQGMGDRNLDATAGWTPPQ